MSKIIKKQGCLFIGICSLFFLTACGGGSSSDTFSGDANSPVRRSGAEMTRFSSDTELEDYLKKGLRAGSSDENQMRYDLMAPEASATDAGGSTQTGKVFSATNLQESGVDEDDTVKSDGQYLYIAPGDYYYPVRIAADGDAETGEETAPVTRRESGSAEDISEIPRTAPAPLSYDEDSSRDAIDRDENMLIAPPPHEAPESAIRVMKLSENPAESAEIASISLADFEKPVNGLYLLTERGEGKSDLLVTVGGKGADMWGCWFSPWYWNGGSTEIGIFNVDTPENPQMLSHIKLDGQLISSRRIGEKLYLVTRYMPKPEGYETYAWDSGAAEKNERILEKTELKDLLPEVEINGENSGRLVETEQCYLPPLNEDRSEEASLITVSSIDLDNPENRVSASIAGPTETVYVSADSIWLATTRYHYQPLMGILEDGTAAAEDTATLPETTDIHKFALTDAGPLYTGSGTVTGHLGWKEDQKPFRMGEYEGILRIATSMGQAWEESPTTRLTLLQEGDDAVLEEISHVDNIGEQGESLYAVRYAGTRAYLVTFRVTDPLYIFDLSDPQNPIKAGELHISGYSDYLHPIGENLLLGIGKDAVPDDSSNDFGGRGAWFQGVKLSLFDVSDPTSPRENDSLVIGKRGTESDALFDHHALAYLPPDKGIPARLALPVRLHNTPYDYKEEPWLVEDADIVRETGPSAWYDWTHTGLYLFEIGTSDIVNTGKMIVEDRNSYAYAPWSSFSDRALILGESVHYIHNNQVWSAPWSDAENMSGPE
ncbi:MAG: beta-propeller domain-containing protein [Desulfococcaceae bacterium]|jgi:uncharacterized secreted protein with C-terminal beta-propeller domain|nr:beta-propeller domain-containing protein [Desulfococcaceae bacterium]